MIKERLLTLLPVFDIEVNGRVRGRIEIMKAVHHIFIKVKLSAGDCAEAQSLLEYIGDSK